MAKKKKEPKEKKPKKEKKAKEIDPHKAARVHGMRFAGAQTRAPALNVYSGLLLGAMLALAAATGYAYFQAKKVAPDGGPEAVFKVHPENTFRLGG